MAVDEKKFKKLYWTIVMGYIVINIIHELSLNQSL